MEGLEACAVSAGANTGRASMGRASMTDAPANSSRFAVRIPLRQSWAAEVPGICVDVHRVPASYYGPDLETDPVGQWAKWDRRES